MGPKKKHYRWTEETKSILVKILLEIQQNNKGNISDILFEKFIKLCPEYNAEKSTLLRTAYRFVGEKSCVSSDSSQLTIQQKDYINELYSTQQNQTQGSIQDSLWEHFVQKYPDFKGTKQQIWIWISARHESTLCSQEIVAVTNKVNEAFKARCIRIFSEINSDWNIMYSNANQKDNEQRYVLKRFMILFEMFFGEQFQGSKTYIVQKYFEWKQSKVVANQQYLLDHKSANMNSILLESLTKYFQLTESHTKLPMFKECCHNCGFLFFSTQQTALRCLLNQPLHGKPMVLDHFVNNDKLPTFMSKHKKFITCSFCVNNPNLHDHYDRYLPGTKIIDIPHELQSLKTDYEKNQIALAGIFSTITQHGNDWKRSFEHRQGHVNAGKKLDQSYYGSFATYYNIERPDINPDSAQKIHKALCWLKKYNHLYMEFLSNYETLYGYLTRVLKVNVNDTTIELTKGNFEDIVNREKKGVLIPADNVKIVQSIKPEDDNFGIQHPQYQTAKLAFNDNQSMVRVSYSDPNLDAKCWPLDHPTGKGSWSLGGALKHRQYWKWNVRNFDNRFRNNTERHFFTFDRYLKKTLLYYNKFSKVVLKKDLTKDITVTDLNKHEGYYGTDVPSAVPGSRSYWQTKNQELLAMVRELSSPALFVTLTQNDNWPELQIESKHMLAEEYNDFNSNCLRPPPITGEAVTNNPVETAIAFNERFKLFMANFIHDKTGPFGNVTDYWYRVEYQGRGAIHVHMLLWTENYNPNCIVSEIPRYNGDNSKLKQYTETLRHYVESFQLHRCIPSRCYKTIKEKALKKCRYGFPFNICEDTVLPEDEVRYLYQRRENEDCRVIPYCPEVLVTMQSHMNVQRVTPRNLEMYLCKYVTKPETNVELRKVGNEVDKFLKSRVLGVLECINILMEFSQAKASREVVYLPCDVDPAYRMLKKKEHLPRDDASTDIYYGNNLDKYLDRPIALRELTYPEFWKWYSVTSTRIKPMTEDSQRDFTQLTQFTQSLSATTPNLTQRGHEFYEIGSKRYTKRTIFAIPRYRFLLPLGDNAEKFYEQLFLLKVPIHRLDLSSASSWFSERNHSKTFMEECMIRKLIDPEIEVKEMLKKAINHGFTEEKLYELTRHFVNQSFISEDEVNSLIQPYLENLPAYERCEVDDYIDDECHQNLMEMFGNGIQIDTLENYKKKLTESQLKTVEWFEAKLSRGEQILAIVTGPGGTGKSFVLRALYALFREHKLKSAIMAPVASAAFLVGGTTIHNYLKLDIKGNSYLQNGTTAAMILSNTDTVFVDEFGMISYDLFEQLDATLRKFPTVETSRPDLPFNGRNVVLMGDCAQLESIEENSIFSHPLISEFSILLLKEIVRQLDPKFAELLSRIRMGHISKDDEDILLSRMANIDDVEYSEDSTIIVAKNDRRDFWNSAFLKKLPGEEVIIEAEDRYSSGNGNQIQTKFVLEKIKKFCKSRLPDKLILKVGAIIILTRRIGEVHEGWPPGVRAKIISIGTNRDYLIIESMDDKKRRMLLRKMRQDIELKNNFQMENYIRVQFPILLGYSQNCHQVQGKSISTNCYVELDNFWASGQGYTALSRVTSLDKLFILKYTKESIMLKPEYTQILKFMDEVDEISDKKKTRTRNDFPLIPFKTHVASRFPEIKIEKPSEAEIEKLNKKIKAQEKQLEMEIKNREKLDIERQLKVLKDRPPYKRPGKNIYEEDVLIGTYHKSEFTISLENEDEELIEELEERLQHIVDRQPPRIVLNKLPALNIPKEKLNTTNLDIPNIHQANQVGPLDGVLLQAGIFQSIFDGDTSQNEKLLGASEFANTLFDYLNNKYDCSSDGSKLSIQEQKNNVSQFFNADLLQFKKQLDALKQLIKNKPLYQYSDQIKDTLSSKLLPKAIINDYQAVKTAPDGNCFFNAVSLSIFGNENYYKMLKLLLANEIVQNKQEWTKLWKETCGKDDYNELLHKILSNSAWANSDVMFAMSKLVERPIFAYKNFPAPARGSRTTIEKLNQLMPGRQLGAHYEYLFNDEFKNRSPICMHHVAYNVGHGRENHFTSLMMRNQVAAVVKPNIQMYERYRCFKNLAENILATVSNTEVQPIRKRLRGGGRKKAITIAAVSIIGILVAHYCNSQGYFEPVVTLFYDIGDYLGVTKHGKIIDPKAEAKLDDYLTQWAQNVISSVEDGYQYFVEAISGITAYSPFHSGSLDDAYTTSRDLLEDLIKSLAMYHSIVVPSAVQILVPIISYIRSKTAHCI